jgi:hypothetical protein
MWYRLRIEYIEREQLMKGTVEWLHKLEEEYQEFLYTCNGAAL